MADGSLRVLLDPVHFSGLPQIASAIEHLQSGSSRGKVRAIDHTPEMTVPSFSKLVCLERERVIGAEAGDVIAGGRTGGSRECHLQAVNRCSDPASINSYDFHCNYIVTSNLNLHVIYLTDS